MAGISGGKRPPMDCWFLYEIQKIVNMEKELTKYKIETLPTPLLQEAKQLGFSDEQIVKIMNSGTEETLYQKTQGRRHHPRL